MKADGKLSRRRFLQQASLTAGIAAATLFLPNITIGAPKGKTKPLQTAKSHEVEVTPTEDLMREHGVLRRLLLVYGNCIERLESHQELDPKTLSDSANIIKRFIEDYHEKLEENYLFPRFRKANRLVDLVNTLQTQHAAGRRVTTTILNYSTMEDFNNPEKRQQLIIAMQQFTRMYEPHAAREDTVLFPALKEIVSPHEYDALGETFEEQEHRLFGQAGFEGVVAQVAEIEKTLGIYNLAQFTPSMPTGNPS